MGVITVLYIPKGVITFSVSTKGVICFVWCFAGGYRPPPPPPVEIMNGPGERSLRAGLVK